MKYPEKEKEPSKVIPRDRDEEEVCPECEGFGWTDEDELCLTCDGIGTIEKR